MTEQMQMTSPQGLTRRHVLGKALGLGAVAVAASVAGTAAAATVEDEQVFVATTALNLRTGPSTRHRVILVMPKYAQVKVYESLENGFLYVNYKGQDGWAHRDYLVRAGDPIGPPVIGNAVTTARVNLRSGPSTGHRVLAVLSKGESIRITAKVQNGFRYIYRHSAPPGWVSDAYLRRIR
jgi:uncharacterized protein YraI